MPDPTTLALFSLAALALIVVPGPAVLYIVAQSIGQGRRAGVASALGVATGGLVHVLAAVVGLSALVASSATAFTTVKWAGAAYLVWIGVRRILAKEPSLVQEAPDRRGHVRLYRQGVVVNVLNPKTALFFLAFLPQFVDPAAGSPGLQAAVLGLVFVVLALLSDAVWAVAAGTAADWLKRSRAFLRAERFVSGSIFVALGLTAAFAGHRKA